VTDKTSAGPFCGLLLSSYGASVLRVDRPSQALSSDLLTSHKTSIALDLKAPASLAVFLSLIPKTDVLIDPFRPGVLEKLGLDPERVLQKSNPKLIVVRLTGFRRDGKYKDMAGHDINYLAVSGVLSLLGARGTPPLPPGNILADFAGGGMVAFVGVLLALIHRGVTGNGQVVEANMVDGVSYLATFPRYGLKTPLWNSQRGTNTLDGGCPFYGCYECRDAGKYMSVGSLEPQFFAELLKGLDLKPEDILPNGIDRHNKKSWPHMRGVLEKRFKDKTRKEWEAIFDGTDACVAPVLEMGELEEQGFDQRPAVGLTQSPGRVVKSVWVGKPLKPGQGGEETMREWMGWKKGKDFDVVNGALVALAKSKL
jgi:alpha-methylacyl-CoA racemase